MDKNKKDNDLDCLLKKIIFEIEWNKKDFENNSISHDAYRKNINNFIIKLKNMCEKT
jgi:hypothetical protein